MDAFLQFLDSDDRVKLCPIFALRTQPNKGLKPVSDYVTVFHNAATQTSSRTYKYAEGLTNLQLTAKGTTLRSTCDPKSLYTPYESGNSECRENCQPVNALSLLLFCHYATMVPTLIWCIQ